MHYCIFGFGGMKIAVAFSNNQIFCNACSTSDHKKVKKKNESIASRKEKWE